MTFLSADFKLIYSMDPTAQNSSENTQPPEPPTGEQPQPVQLAANPTDQQSGQSGNPFTSHKLFLPFIIIVIIILTIAIFTLVRSGKSDKKIGPTPTPTTTAVKKAVQPTPVATKTQTLVYGTWTSQSSVIRAVNLEDNSIKTVATLPLTIKKISVLTPSSLLYIDQTDSNDHGQRISVYDFVQKQITVNIPATDGYGIDDYILSPDKRYLAIWEVKFSPTTNTLAGGQSRIYAVDLQQPSVVNLLYDEDTTANVGSKTQSVPIHYPIAILGNGKVYTDQLLPNDPNGGTGWAYGMSMVDFDGTNKQDITSMTNGTYGSKPTLSPDGKFLLFAGYDGNNGDGTKIKNGYRQALLTPDTVELLDVNSLNRYKLPNLPPSNTYSDVQWDKQTANVVISILSADTKQMGVFVYDLGKLSTKQLPLPQTDDTQYGYISQLTDNKTLIGIQSNDPSNLGNLGETYAFAYTQLATIDDAGKLDYISAEDPFVQYITILPGNYFNNVLGDQTSKQTTPEPTFAVLQGTDTTPQSNNTFLKTTLASLRIQGKSNPPSSTIACQTLGNARCSALSLTTDSTEYQICRNIEKANNRTGNACY